jgi:hypothetical protein
MNASSPISKQLSLVGKTTKAFPIPSKTLGGITVIEEFASKSTKRSDSQPLKHKGPIDETVHGIQTDRIIVL